jgi:carbon-monoxide dehydrogenase small subunit
MQIKCQINNRDITRDIAPDLLLIDFLRDLGFKSVKRGCDTANCGLCTVWVNEKPMLSCAVLTARVNGESVTTLEGLEAQAKRVGRFLADQGAEQCGYCSPGLIMNILAMEKEFAFPTREEICQYLAGNLCRCSGYEGQIRAVIQYFESKNPGGHHGNGK